MLSVIKALCYIPILIVAPNATNWGKFKDNCKAAKVYFTPKQKAPEQPVQ